MDQQYDKTVIEPQRGEMWAWTVADAEEAGFRRAFRWKGAGGEGPMDGAAASGRPSGGRGATGPASGGRKR
jgi:hypothetical protein